MKKKKKKRQQRRLNALKMGKREMRKIPCTDVDR